MQGVRCWVIVVGCWVVMKSGCLGMEVGLWMFGVEAPHMLCERPRTCGADGKHQWC